MKIGRRTRASAQPLDDVKSAVEEPAAEQPSCDSQKLALEVSVDEQVAEAASTDASSHSHWSTRVTVDKSAVADFVQAKLATSKFLLASAQSQHAALSQGARASLYCVPLLLLAIAYLCRRRRKQRTTHAGRACADESNEHYKMTPTRTTSTASTSNCFSSLNVAVAKAAAAAHDVQHTEQQASVCTSIAAPPRMRRACSHANTLSPARELSPARLAAASPDDKQGTASADSATAVSDNSTACTALANSAAQALRQLLTQSSASTAAIAAALQSVSQRSVVFVPRAAFLSMGRLLSLRECAAQALHVRGDAAAALTAPVLYVAAPPAGKGESRHTLVLSFSRIPSLKLLFEM
jgi:hypothetical protein